MSDPSDRPLFFKGESGEAVLHSDGMLVVRQPMTPREGEPFILVSGFYLTDSLTDWPGWEILKK